MEALIGLDAGLRLVTNSCEHKTADHQIRFAKRCLKLNDPLEIHSPQFRNSTLRDKRFPVCAVQTTLNSFFFVFFLSLSIKDHVFTEGFK